MNFRVKFSPEHKHAFRNNTNPNILDYIEQFYITTTDNEVDPQCKYVTIILLYSENPEGKISISIFNMQCVCVYASVCVRLNCLPLTLLNWRSLSVSLFSLFGNINIYLHRKLCDKREYGRRNSKTRTITFRSNTCVANSVRRN